MILVWSKKIPAFADPVTASVLKKQGGVSRYVLCGSHKWLIWDAPVGKGESSKMPSEDKNRFEKLKLKVMKF